ncbi:S-adenosyl-L-methionine-dependent methyltransferase [Dactylonectria macrodidyma]|uniref:S-adenosyl-L-methionine-dependent methyltransferase n=1 Tax=Dactylonectria macrodidyma TaxID=307937 RepID=A0A9P9JG82_9HYPO|nr:S-adenosyl-L-methionine-dependent methyltransferase [Dactylonectria macrodidyma]
MGDAPSDTKGGTTQTPPAATLENIGVIEADNEEENDADSSLGDDDAASSTASLASSVLRYREENGRTYHAYKDGAYVMPNDIREQERLDLQHNLFLITFEDKLYLSPAGRNGQKLKHVLDVGTGTGLWAIDFADEHPEAEVIGVDLSPIQSDMVPPNLSFQVDDLEAPWTFTSKFDFIYSRMMTAAFADWPRFFEQAYENLTPGGWLEVTDICPLTTDDGSLPQDSAAFRWVTQLLEGTRAVGRPFDGAFKYREQLQTQGFTNITQVIYKWPQNRWPKHPKLKEIGTWNLENITSGLEGLSAAVFTRVLGWTKEELDIFLVDVRKDLKNTAYHTYWPIITVYAQKPVDA